VARRSFELYEEMAATGLSQSAIARQLGISRQAVNRVFVANGVRVRGGEICFICGGNYRTWDLHYLTPGHKQALAAFEAGIRKVIRDDGKE
jgi:transcriptional regulator with XRE-family HTH domain